VTWDLIFGIIRYFGLGAAMVVLYHVSYVEQRCSDAFEAGFTTGQVYADPDVRPRRANV